MSDCDLNMKKIYMADPHFNEADRKWIHREIDLILDGALSMRHELEFGMPLL